MSGVQMQLESTDAGGALASGAIEQCSKTNLVDGSKGKDPLEESAALRIICWTLSGEEAWSARSDKSSMLLKTMSTGCEMSQCTLHNSISLDFTCCGVMWP